ncbi:Dihydrodipicolinate synthase, partial [Coemansia biformis]
MAQDAARAAFASAFDAAAAAKLADGHAAPQGTVSLLKSLAQYVVPDPTNKTHMVLLGLVVFFVIRSITAARSGSRSEPFAMEGVRRKPVPAKRDFTPHELAENDGRDEVTPLYIGVKGIVYDVSPSRAFYGPGGPYANFAGRDASRGLALASFDKDVLTDLDDPIDDLSDLEKPEQASLDEWAEFFAGKYTPVGKL